MQNAGTGEEHLETVAVKKVNITYVVDEIDRCVSQMNCISYGHFKNYYLMIPNSPQGNVANQVTLLADPYPLSQR